MGKKGQSEAKFGDIQNSGGAGSNLWVQESPSDLWCNLVTLVVEGACNYFGLYRYMWNNVNIK